MDSSPSLEELLDLLHDNLQYEKKITNLVTVGVLESSVTIRATDESNFSVHDLIKFIDKKSPDAFAEGGGHKNAGSITFLPNKQKNVVSLIKEFIKERN